MVGDTPPAVSGRPAGQVATGLVAALLLVLGASCSTLPAHPARRQTRPAPTAPPARLAPSASADPGAPASSAATPAPTATAAPAGGTTPSTGRTTGAGAGAAPTPGTITPGQCHARNQTPYTLPDPSCTPGATNPAVSQATIGRTICVAGWTSSVRPPVSYTEPLKRAQLAWYGDTAPIWTFEEDHLIPLELGGSPTSPQNLWPEPGASPNLKDAVEDAAHRAVCDGRLSLRAAQTAIASNWVALGEQLGVVGAAPTG